MDGDDTANLLTGTGSDEIIRGMEGNDTLSGGAGNDTLVGGIGFDTFVVNPGDENIEIADFTLFSDRLDLSAFERSAVAQALLDAQGDDAVVLTLPDGTQISLRGEGLSVSNLDLMDVRVSGENQAPQGALQISGDLELGSELSIDVSQITDADGIREETLNITWFRDGVAIPGANAATYTVTDEDIGSDISAQFTYFDVFGAFETVSSAASGDASDPGTDDPSDPQDPGDEPGPTDEPDVPQIGDGVNDTPVTATPFPDVFVVRDGVTFIDGLGGDDTAVFTGSRSDYTISVGDDETRVVDTRPDGHGTVTLQNVELIRFELPDSDGDDTLVLRQISTELSVFDSLNAQELDTLVEMYIAYFNRAPDADGLAFWSASYLDGYSIEDIAGMFAAQPELEALYPEDQNPVRFVADVYDNVFGRAPDLQGLTFWKDVLADGSVSPDAFILEVLRGVDAEPSSGAPQARIDQQVSDQEYLDLKTDLGIHFAVTRGLTSVEDAATILDGFDGSQASFDATIEEIDALYAEAVLLTSPADDVSVVGVTDTVTDM